MKRLAAALFGFVALGCAEDRAAPEPIAIVGLDLATPAPGVEAVALPDKPRGIYIVVPKNPEEKTPRIGPGPKHRIIYMNRNGGTFTPGFDNSSSNVSSVPNNTATVSAWSYGDAKWNELMTCVRAMYARWDVEVTDKDPGSVPHIESVVGGTPGQVGLPNGVGGVAPVNGDCSVVERAVVYTFSAVYGGDVQSICETVAQETGHALGMDHALYCPDPMTYLYGCGAKTFQDKDVSCGENSARTCMCGGTTQNSVKHLNAVLGPADAIAPNVDLLQPANGATVMTGFLIEAAASDDKTLAKVDLYVDGGLVATKTAPPFTFTAPTTLLPGAHTLEVRATDGAGNTASDGVTVTLQSAAPECVTDGDCGANEICSGGACVPRPGTPGGTGSTCDSGDDCASGLCATSGNTQICTETCTTDGDCPAGYGCRDAGATRVCWPSSGGGGGDPAGDPPSIIGGCSIGLRGAGGTAAVLLVLVALFLLGRRRA